LAAAIDVKRFKYMILELLRGPQQVAVSLTAGRIGWLYCRINGLFVAQEFRQA
jgi:hypothetical protein